MKDPKIILLADESDDDVVLIQLAFKAARIPPSTQLQVVRSGEEAIAYVEGKGKYADRADYPRPSLLLLDLKMPGTDGFDVLRRLRSEPTLHSLRVIVLTTSAEPAKASEAYHLGANAFLLKPGSFEGLMDLARSIHCECHHPGTIQNASST
jgi:CheY-like chemotaxis protein